MGGIAGWVADNARLDAAREAALFGSMDHRGPDGRCLQQRGPALMAQTYLDADDRGGMAQQPPLADSPYVVLVDAVIYNLVELRAKLEIRGYEFWIGSESEVIAHAYAEYGDECVTHLHGMFAFALWDDARQRLLLARDRLGVKPLYVKRRGNGWAFASEIKSLLTLGGDTPGVNPDALAVFMQGQFGLGGETLLDGVESLEMGHIATIECGNGGYELKRSNYWSLLDTRRSSLDIDSASVQFHSLIDEVMRAELRSDIPYGLFLSGGLDSAILLGLAARLSDKPLHTFSLAFKEHATAHELTLAPHLARQFHTRHTPIEVRAADLQTRIADTVWASDLPNFDLANLPTAVLATAASQEVKVVLTGEGADAGFGGNTRYGANLFRRWRNNLRSPGSGGYRVRGRTPPDVVESLYQPGLRMSEPAWRSRIRSQWQCCPGHWSDFQRMQYGDFSGEIQDSLGVKVDRILMRHSIEGRIPFLDHRIAAFGLSLPDRLKLRRGVGKYFLREWAEPLLGKEVVSARKRGFRVPLIDALLSESFIKRLTPALTCNHAVTNYFQPGGVAQLAGRALSDRNAGKALWSILVFALWHRMIVENGGVRPPTDIDPLEILA